MYKCNISCMAKAAPWVVRKTWIPVMALLYFLKLI